MTPEEIYNWADKDLELPEEKDWAAEPGNEEEEEQE